MNIEGKKVYLRAMELEDMPVYMEMMNNKDVSHNVVGWSFPVSQFEQQKWYENAISSSDKRFSIVIKESDQCVGMITLTDIDWVNRSAFHGIKLHPNCPKRLGIATDAIMALMEYAFCELNLNRLDGGWLDYNKASEQLYEKCGWSKEGIKRNAIYRNGKYHDLVIAGILKEDYLCAKDHSNA